MVKRTVLISILVFLFVALSDKAHSQVRPGVKDTIEMMFYDLPIGAKFRKAVRVARKNNGNNGVIIKLGVGFPTDHNKFFKLNPEAKHGFYAEFSESNDSIFMREFEEWNVSNTDNYEKAIGIFKKISYSYKVDILTKGIGIEENGKCTATSFFLNEGSTIPYAVISLTENPLMSNEKYSFRITVWDKRLK